MNRFVLAVAITVGYLAIRSQPGTVPVAPVTPAVAPVAEIATVARTMEREDRDALADAYAVLSKSVGSDPPVDPVFTDTAALRRAHRAMLLCVWRGVLDNNPNSVPGLKDAVEGVFSRLIGTDDVPLNPSSRQDAAKALADISQSFR